MCPRMALALVRRNAALNGVQDIVTTTCANVFDLARQYVREGRQYRSRSSATRPRLPKAARRWKMPIAAIRNSICSV